MKRTRCLCLGLGLAAFPLGAQSPAMPPLTAYYPGVIHLQLSASQRSELGVDLAKLEDQLCPSEAEARGFMPPGETCRLVIANDGSHGGLNREAEPSVVTASTSALALPYCGPAQVNVLPTGLSLAGVDPIVLSCGSWKLTAKLSTSVIPQPSPLTLVPPLAGAPTGIFHGTLALSLDVTYTLLGTEIAYTELKKLDLDVSGRWTIVPGSALSALPPAESNLALFVDREPIADSAWNKKTGCGQARKGCSHLCLVGSTAVVDALNGLAAQ